MNRNSYLVRKQAKEDAKRAVPLAEQKRARIIFLLERLKVLKTGFADIQGASQKWLEDWSIEENWLQEYVREAAALQLNVIHREYNRAKAEWMRLANDEEQTISDDMIERARNYDICLLFDDVRKVGITRLAVCPFHDDAHPSMVIYSGEDPHYHCFVCGAHGDGISILMDRDGLSFKQAVKTLQ